MQCCSTIMAVCCAKVLFCSKEGALAVGRRNGQWPEGSMSGYTGIMTHHRKPATCHNSGWSGLFLPSSSTSKSQRTKFQVSPKTEAEWMPEKIARRKKGEKEEGSCRTEVFALFLFVSPCLFGSRSQAEESTAPLTFSPLPPFQSRKRHNDSLQ
jgi:hypothetical protein